MRTFCLERDIDPTGLTLTQEATWNTEEIIKTRVKTHVRLPDGFPEKYKRAIAPITETCTVTRLALHLNPSSFECAVD
ncbi:MAG: hypothetical protein HKM93_04285 [Desulfobacteraceae bacterium]|nr:hypothetical protein [Desulfobacteraceae bacterium]